MVTAGMSCLARASYLSGLSSLNTLCALPGLSKQSLGLLDTDDDDVDRDDGELHAVNDAVCALDEVDASLKPECARGRRGFLRKPSSLSESELDEDATPARRTTCASFRWA